MPLFVFFLFDGLYPVIGDTHGHTVVEADAPLVIAHCQSRHAAHLFGYGYSLWIHFMDKYIGQSEISYCGGVLRAVIIIFVRAERFAQPVVVIQHRGHSVEPESVEPEFFQPVFAVGQQEMQY